jgi:hypothetical protein
MRVSLLLLPLLAIGVAGCVDVHSHPAPRDTTVVTPAPAPAPVYAAPAYAVPDATTGTTVVTRP